MIKFFRNIRQRLLQKNRFTRYLIYAVGEIILVVVGILIALQVNNWNNEQSAKKERKDHIEELNTELHEYRRFGNVLKSMTDFVRESDSILGLVATGSITMEQYKERPDLLFPMFSDRIENLLEGDAVVNIFNLEAAEIIMQQRSDFDPKYDKLLFDIKMFQSNLSGLGKILNQSAIERMKFKDFMLNNHPWIFSVDSTNIDKAIRFSNTDSVYRIRAKLFRNGFDDITRKLTSIMAYQKAISADLIFLNGGSTSDVVKSFAEYDYHKMPEMPCDDTSNTIEIENLFQFNPIYNTTNKELALKRLGLNYQILESFKILPGEILVIGHPPGAYYQINDGDECLGRYLTQRDSYLLIE